MAELEDKYSRFLRNFNIDIETIEENAASGGGGGVTDHGALTGLADDDHIQYLNNVRGDARYYTKTQTDALIPQPSDDFPNSIGEFNSPGTGDLWARHDHTHNGLTVAKLGDYRPVNPFSRYGYKTGTSEIDNFTGSASVADAWFAKVFVPAGMAISKIGTIVKTAGTLDAGGLNGFAIWSEDGQTQIFTSSTNNIWTTNGNVSVNLGGAAIAAQATDKYYWCGFASKGYSVAPVMLYHVLDPVLVDASAFRRSFYSGDISWPATFNPATHGNPSSGYIPMILLG